MSEPKSLAEFLGVPDPNATPEARASAAAAARASRRASIKEFCRSILDSPEYHASIVRRIDNDELPPVIELAMYHYAHGKPVERMEIDTDPKGGRLEELSVDQLESRIKHLALLAREHRRREEQKQRTDEGEGASPPDVLH